MATGPGADLRAAVPPPGSSGAAIRSSMAIGPGREREGRGRRTQPRRWRAARGRALYECAPARRWRPSSPTTSGACCCRAGAGAIPAGVSAVRHRSPSRVLFGAAAVAGGPRLERLLGGCDVLWAPAPAPLALGDGVPFVLTVHDRSWELRPGDFTRYERAWHALARPRRLGRARRRACCATRRPSRAELHRARGASTPARAHAVPLAPLSRARAGEPTAPGSRSGAPLPALRRRARAAQGARRARRGVHRGARGGGSTRTWCVAGDGRLRALVAGPGVAAAGAGRRRTARAALRRRAGARAAVVGRGLRADAGRGARRTACRRWSATCRCCARCSATTARSTSRRATGSALAEALLAVARDPGCARGCRRRPVRHRGAQLASGRHAPPARSSRRRPGGELLRRRACCTTRRGRCRRCSRSLARHLPGRAGRRGGHGLARRGAGARPRGRRRGGRSSAPTRASERPTTPGSRAPGTRSRSCSTPTASCWTTASRGSPPAARPARRAVGAAPARRRRAARALGASAARARSGRSLPALVHPPLAPPRRCALRVEPWRARRPRTVGWASRRLPGRPHGDPAARSALRSRPVPVL